MKSNEQHHQIKNLFEVQYQKFSHCFINHCQGRAIYARHKTHMRSGLPLMSALIKALLCCTSPSKTPLTACIFGPLPKTSALT